MKSIHLFKFYIRKGSKQNSFAVNLSQLGLDWHKMMAIE